MCKIHDSKFTQNDWILEKMWYYKTVVLLSFERKKELE